MQSLIHRLDFESKTASCRKYSRCVCVFTFSLICLFLPFVDSFQFKFFKLFCSLAFSKRFSFTSCRALQLHA